MKELGEGPLFILLFIIMMTWWLIIPAQPTCRDGFMPMFGLVEGSCPIGECGTISN